MIVENTKVRVIFIGGMDGVRFIPGLNTLRQSDLDFIEGQKKYKEDFKELQEVGSLIVRNTTISKSEYKFEGMKATELKKMIPEIFDIDDLESIVENGSKAVASAAQKQIDAIESQGE